MQRSCDACGNPYEAKRASSKFCGVNCRNRKRPPGVKAKTKAAVPTIKTTSAGLVSATERELESVGRLDTMLGQVALELARRVSSPFETGASVASMTKQLRETMTDALKGAAVASDVLDELRNRRDSKRLAG